MKLKPIKILFFGVLLTLVIIGPIWLWTFKLNLRKLRQPPPPDPQRAATMKDLRAISQELIKSVNQIKTELDN